MTEQQIAIYEALSGGRVYPYTARKPERNTNLYSNGCFFTPINYMAERIGEYGKPVCSNCIHNSTRGCTAL